MEMTIARDRWQQHLKTRGVHYLDVAAQVRALHASYPLVGADVAALALECLGGVLEACRVGRLTRNQHVLLRLGELIAYAESAAALVRRAVAAAEGALPDKADRRFDAAGLAAVSRVFAREAALKVAEEGVRWVSGAAEQDASAQLLAGLPLEAVRAAQVGLLADMDAVADVLYDRVAP
jgi:alkylation response protein AidB-like acyl-CoA dehydrogenase